MTEITHAKKPPKLVLGAISLLAVSYVLGFGRVSSSLLLVLLFLAIVAAIVAGLYKGVNWVRWLVVISTLVGLATIPWHFPGTFSERAIYLTQGVLQAVAAILLVLPSAGRWYRPNNSFKPKPLRGSA